MVKNADLASAVERFLDRFWQGVGRYVISHYRLVKWACVLLLILGIVRPYQNQHDRSVAEAVRLKSKNHRGL